MCSDGPLDEVRLLVVGRERFELRGVLDALGFLLLTEFMAGAALGESSHPLRLGLPLDPQRFGAGLTASGAQVRLIRLQRAPQVTLEVVEFVDPVAPCPAVRAADA